jgi:hypothetical protein
VKSGVKGMFCIADPDQFTIEHPPIRRTTSSKSLCHVSRPISVTLTAFSRGELLRQLRRLVCRRLIPFGAIDAGQPDHF